MSEGTYTIQLNAYMHGSCVSSVSNGITYDSWDEVVYACRLLGKLEADEPDDIYVTYTPVHWTSSPKLTDDELAELCARSNEA